MERISSSEDHLLVDVFLQERVGSVVLLVKGNIHDLGYGSSGELLGLVKGCSHFNGGLPVRLGGSLEKCT